MTLDRRLIRGVFLSVWMSRKTRPKSVFDPLNGETYYHRTPVEEKTSKIQKYGFKV